MSRPPASADRVAGRGGRETAGGRRLARLARLGFADADRAWALLGPSGLRLWDAAANAPTDPGAASVVSSLGRAADPDLAALALARLVEAAGDDAGPLLDRLRADSRVRGRLIGVLGASSALGDHLVAHPEDWRLLDSDDGHVEARSHLAAPPGDGPAEGGGHMAAPGSEASVAFPGPMTVPPGDGPAEGGGHVAASGGVTSMAVPTPVTAPPDEANDRAGHRAALLAAVGADPEDPPTGTGGAAARNGGADIVAALRVAYRRRLLPIAARDLAGEVEVEQVAAELADLAAATLSAGLAVARAALPAGAAPCRLAVIGMGKCGGRELNYVSDVDVVFVAEPADSTVDETAALQTATALASELVRVCGGVAWPVDAALRPEGRVGPLVRTLASHEAYYRRWARTWEFQALLKARPVAGDLALGREYVARLAPLVWTAGGADRFVDDVQAMRRRVEEAVPPALAEREIKLGRGGLRDVEFAVQLLQLVHGRADESLREPATLDALAALSAGGYVGRHDAATLAASYRFLRLVEHRLQLQRLRRTHLVPDDPAGLRWLARALGYRPDRRGDAVAVFHAEWALHAREVRRLHEKLFYRPLLGAVARVPVEGLRLTPEAARHRLEALGFADPDGALRHLEALTAGVSRRAAIQRALLPVMLESFADAPDPDAGLLGYRQVSDALEGSPWYLRLLRDSGQVAQRLSLLLGTSRYVADLLVRAPEGLRLLGSDEELRPRGGPALRTALQAAVARNDDPSAAVAAARALRRQELLRIACADLLGLLDVVDVGVALTDVIAAALEAALDAATRSVLAGRAGAALPTRVAVVAMGRLGGAEVGYGSDADVLFVHDPHPGADERDASDAAHAVAEELRRLLALPAPDPPLLVDAGLRPEGRSGPLVRTLASYAAYYARWSSFWEAQALLRAVPVAGDREVGDRFAALIDPVRYPPGGPPADAVTEIRRLKARVDAERLPRGADPATHTKLGRGGLADVEWTVQLLQLRYGASVPALRTTRTLDALAAAADAGLLGPDDAAALEAAWRMATRARNAVMLVRGRASDQLPRHGRELTGVARAMGYPPGRDPGQLLDDYRRATRRARRVVERVFYG
jgi:[glutamine synthetase] adenylyltransferase / [glutamine synthetase]-adenylyl-L-tyrosine phosphorylase